MPGGRPLKYKTVAEIEPLIDAYFKNTPESEWTVSGLADALDTSRDILIAYEGRDEFSNTIKKAKDKVHISYEKDLRKKGRSGDIFALKNFGWRDKQELDHTTKGESLNESAVIKELAEKLNALQRGTGVAGDGAEAVSMDTEARD